jgi:hypothetical protein
MFRRALHLSCLWIAAAALAFPLAAGTLTDDQKKMLMDPRGWQYIAILDEDNGLQMRHQCFVQDHPETGACEGTLQLTSDRTFSQRVTVHGESLVRHGTYDLDNDQMTLKDELGTKDGPYVVEVNDDKKTMRISMRQAGVLVGADLQLVSEYERAKNKKRQNPSQYQNPPQQ